MKKKHVYISIFILIILLSIPLIVNTGGLRNTELRCNRHIISRGDHKYWVNKRIKQCGTVLSKEVVQTGDGNIKAENWFIKINNRCYSIRFVGSVLENIGKRVICD
jgi:hypothetical protein